MNLTNHIVRSSFSISSHQLGAEDLAKYFPWGVTEATVPNDKLRFYLTCFDDLGVGQHDRVDTLLSAVKSVFLAYESDLNALSEDCKYTLWIDYRFPREEGAFNICPSLSAAFFLLRVELVFHLKAN